MGGVALLFHQRSYTRAVFCDDILPRPLSALHAAKSLFLTFYVFFECAYQNISRLSWWMIRPRKRQRDLKMFVLVDKPKEDDGTLV